MPENEKPKTPDEPSNVSKLEQRRKPTDSDTAQHPSAHQSKRPVDPKTLSEVERLLAQKELEEDDDEPEPPLAG